MSTGLAAGQIGQRYYHPQHNERISVSYITGSHAFKAGLTTMGAKETYGSINVNQALSYQFLNGAPVSLNEWAAPAHQEMGLRMSMGLYGPDQWTVKTLARHLAPRA